jgi:Ca2+-binding RTX toxin-like protein
MQTSVTRAARTLALTGATTAALALLPSAGSAAVVDLHVEAGGKSLAPGLQYATGSTGVRTDRSRPACNGSGDVERLRGATALGALVQAADTRRALRPVRVSDQFSFGLLVCGVGDFRATSEAFWLYKVNHVAPEVGGDQRRVRNGDEVLWYRSDASRGVNTGDELDVVAPARARTGQPFTARVFAFTATGARSPAAGATVTWRGGEATADADGRATIQVEGEGELGLRAGRGADVPSPTERVCVAQQLNDCSRFRGQRLFGTDGANRLVGTRGRDVISAGRGNDRIDVRGGGRDVVRCGPGFDRVRASRDDRVARDCEIVNGKRRRGR